ncbi:uncharacterized protein ATC70_010757 [Mucor velutinosus]|uniref:Core domain-containing protein n=1 Tax=Mucor velutinosus TaxID=708070 RepID=A0AAN7DF48_9FUNG|nr:hypothetical protein ATC70_010757 [Mucor velutinosus]
MIPTHITRHAAKTIMTHGTRQLKLSKAPLTLTTAAVSRLKELSSGDHPQFLRVGVKSKGCSGNSYMMEFTETRGKFDEIVDQQGIFEVAAVSARTMRFINANHVFVYHLYYSGVTVLVDSKALLTVLGSEMDYVEDALSSQFVFHNPNVKGTCGCGESFTI